MTQSPFCVSAFSFMCFFMYKYLYCNMKDRMFLVTKYCNFTKLCHHRFLKRVMNARFTLKLRVHQDMA